MHTIHKVREFHEAFDHPIADKVDDMTPEVRALRVRLIAEELAELCHAWGVNLSMTVLAAEPEETDQLSVIPLQTFEVDHVEGADALGDLDYVVQGANLVAGYPSEAVLDEIHLSNMSKLGEDGKPIKREDGKILKGPNYYAPQQKIQETLVRFPGGYWGLYDPSGEARAARDNPPIPDAVLITNISDGVH